MSRPWAGAATAAVLALAASIVAAAGPAHEEWAVYAWPPQSLPDTQPAEGWYTPLPLLNRVPASLELRLPCNLARPLRRGAGATILATARRSTEQDALRVTGAPGAIQFAVGTRAIARVPWPATCPLEVVVERGALVLPGRTVQLQTTALDGMPIVTGLFSTLDLAAGEAPRVIVRTRVYATTQTTAQFVATVLALVLASLALYLIARASRRRRLLQCLRQGTRSAWRARDVTDAVVLGVLLIWWIVAPTIFDDGWIWVENRALFDLGALNPYFTSWGLNLPFGYWLEWLLHWLSGATSALVILRLPPLLALLGTWLVCRWCLERLLAGSVPTVARWTLAGVFLVWATAWGMTLRPEPFVSLLTVVSLAAMVSFALTPRLAPLTIAVPAAVLAATAHPAGVVAAAPIVAALPECVAWLRRERRYLVPIAVMLLAGFSLALTIFVLDSDLRTRVEEARLLRRFHPLVAPWWHDYVRYEAFDERNGGGIAGRRLSVALLLLSVAAWLIGRRRRHVSALSLPARSVALGLLMFVFVPSKLIWHFATLAAVGAVAAAAEVARWRELTLAGRRSIWWIAPVAAVAAIALWSWTAPGNWPSIGPPALDLQRLSWDDVFNLGGYGVLLAAGICAALVLRARGQRERAVDVKPDQRPDMFGWAVAFVSFAVVGVTATVLIIDAAITPWSVARQNLGALTGRQGCGLADQLRGDRDVSSLLTRREAPTLLSPPVALYFPCATTPDLRGGLVEVPSFGAFWWSRWPLEMPVAPFTAIADLYGVRRVARGKRGIEVVEISRRVPGFARVDATRLHWFDAG